MYREEVIAKALREHKEKLSGRLLKNRNRQKELIEYLEEHQLAIKALDSMVKGMGQERPSPVAMQAPLQAPPIQRPLAVEEIRDSPRTPEPQAQATIRMVERKGLSRDRLKAVTFPFIASRFAEEPFEVSKVRDLLDELEPEVSHTYEAAWNLCNDLLREGKLKQAGLRRLPKGIVRLFMLKTATANNRPAAQAGSEATTES